MQNTALFCLVRLAFPAAVLYNDSSGSSSLSMTERHSSRCGTGTGKESHIMKIGYSEEKQIFHITGGGMSYAFAAAGGKLLHLWFGAALTDGDLAALLSVPSGLRAELPTAEAFDYSEPCLRAVFSDGAETLRLRYVSHRAEDGKLTVLLRDESYPFEAELIYETWGDLPLIGRRLVLRNTGAEPMLLRSAKSGVFRLPSGRTWRVTHFSGNWGAEYGLGQQIMTQARLVLENRRLTAAAAAQVPFFAMDEEGHAAETSGEVWFGVLGWSGDFQITVEEEYGKRCAVTGGVSDATSELRLAGGETFETPLFTGGYSDAGFGRMSEILYDWQYDHILPRGGSFDKAHAVRPIIYNSWYPYEFNVDEEHLFALIPKAKYVGAELFVIDDGWMKGRCHDHAGLGDWVADKARFPGGLGRISDACHEAGLQFGIWVEPEMVNPDSDLYRADPDWVLSEPNRERTLQRNQCILDLSRDDIRDWCIGWLDDLIIDARLDYLKWDMNRFVTETGLYAMERGVPVKYMQNIMAIWKHLNECFPDLLLENCASGGGRADFGMVPYADRVNRSDNADPIDVMLLHEGYSTLFVPKSAGGAGNVSPCPNGVNGRAVPLSFRLHSGMTGSMSIGINLLRSDDAELDAIRAAAEQFKFLRPALQDSYVYRVSSARHSPFAVFEYCRRDRSQFTVFAFAHGAHQWDKELCRFRMQGLIPDAVYVCGSQRLTGAALMRVGIDISLRGDYDSRMLTFRRE